MAVCMMQAVGPKQAVLIVLLLTSFVCSQDYQMLIENCNWTTTNLVTPTRGGNVILTRPSANQVYNLVCRTRLYINDLTYTLKMRVRSFDLQGPSYCDLYSEKITLQISDTEVSKNIRLCRGMYAEELILPVQAMTLTYNSGSYGQDAGFQLEFSAVPPSSCYDERKLEATTQPMLLYSPNFPGNYKSNLYCAVQLYAREDQYIQIQSKLVKIESAIGCIYDALIINDERYCGKDPINVIVPASTVDIKFVTDGTKEMDGYILVYEALPTEILSCASSVNYSVIATDTTTVFVMNASTGSRRPKRSSWCTVVLDSGSDDKVLDMEFMSDLSDVEGYQLSIDGEAQYSQNGKLTIDSGRQPSQNSGETTLNFLHSPARRVVFSVRLQTGKKFMFNVKAVDQRTFLPDVLANHTLVWVSTKLYRSPEYSQMSVKPAASGENIEVRVFYTDKDHTTLDLDADRLPVANYVLVYNGDDTSCFELTQGCSSDMSSPAKSVYSIKSQSVTVVVRVIGGEGFWIYFAPAAESYLPQPEELTSYNTLSTKIDHVNVKNLYCEWTLSAASQLDMARNGKIIRLKAESNFVSDSSLETFFVKEEENEDNVMKYTSSTRSDIWMYSRKAIRITVSVFNTETNLLPRYFLFESEILDSAAEIQPLSCQVQTLQANKTVQYAATPNYPAFFQNKPCEWTIVQDTESGRRNSIVIYFPVLSDFLCSEGHELQIQTRNSRDDFISWPKICNVSSFRQSYQYDQVKITFVSRFQYLLPGFRFMYYIIAPLPKEVTLQATEEFQFLSSPNYPASYPSSIDYKWHIMARSDSSVVDFDLMDFTLEEETRLQCIHDYVDIYDGSSTTAENLIKTICGSVFYGQYSSTDSDLTVVFHSDGQNNYKGFRFKYRSREKDSREFNISVPGQNITGIIIGVIAGGVVLIALIVAAVIYVLRKRKRPRPNTRTPAAPRRGPVPGSDSSVFILSGAPISPDYAPPSYWETHNSLANNDPPSYASVHHSADHIIPEYATGYSCENPGLNLLELPPPYSSELPVSTLQPELYLVPDAPRLDSLSSDENTDNRTWPDPNSATDLRDRDDRMNDSACSSNPTEDNTTTGVATQATNNHFNNSQMTDPPPAYENTLYGQINSGERHDPRQVPHKKNDRLGFL